MSLDEISREEAKELLDNAQFGFIIVGSTHDIPSIGEIPMGEKKMKVELDKYKFGDIDGDD